MEWLRAGYRSVVLDVSFVDLWMAFSARIDRYPAGSEPNGRKRRTCLVLAASLNASDQDRSEPG